MFVSRKCIVGCVLGMAVSAFPVSRYVLGGNCARNHTTTCGTNVNCGTCEPCGNLIVYHNYQYCAQDGASGYQKCTTPVAWPCATAYSCPVNLSGTVCGVQNGDPTQPLYPCGAAGNVGTDIQNANVNNVDNQSGNCPQSS